MPTFIGLGLYDERSIPAKGRGALADADRAFAEFYTSHLIDATVEELGVYHDIDIEVRDHAGVKQDPGPILDAAEDEHIVFLTAGDTMISTTHADLWFRVEDRDIEMHLIHGMTAQSAASGLTGLQNYHSGRAVMLPFPYVHGGDPVPKNVVDSLGVNCNLGLYMPVYLDVEVDWEGRRGVEVGGDQYITAGYAVELFVEHWDADAPGVAIRQTGSPDPVVAADRLLTLVEYDFGTPLHVLVIPGEVHHVEADALSALDGTFEELFDDEN